MKHVISPPSNAMFPPFIIAIGVAFVLMSFLIMSKILVLGLFIFVLATLVVIARTGFEIDLKAMKARQYNAYFGIKTGQWTDISSYRQMSVLSTRMGATMYSRSNRSVTDHSLFFRVVLLSEDHLRKFPVYESSSKQRADKVVQEMVNHMGIQLVRYSPTSSRKRRRRR